MCNERGRKVHEREIVPGFDLPAHEQRAKPIVPTIRAFDDPAPRPTVDAADEGRFALLTDVGGNPAGADRGVAIAKRIAFVETAVLRAPDAAPCAQDDGVEGPGERPLVVQIGGA